MKINVQLDPDGTITEMDESDLVKTSGILDNDHERTTWVEYRLAADPNGRAVHRSVHVSLKKPAVFADGAIGKIGA